MLIKNYELLYPALHLIGRKRLPEVFFQAVFKLFQNSFFGFVLLEEPQLPADLFLKHESQPWRLQEQIALFLFRCVRYISERGMADLFGDIPAVKELVARLRPQKDNELAAFLFHKTDTCLYRLN